MTELAERHGTPALLVAEGALRDRARQYADGLAARRPGSTVAFASKAFPCTAVYRLLAEEGLGIDVASGGELALALAAGADPARVIVHGNAKTDAYLRAGRGGRRGPCRRRQPRRHRPTGTHPSRRPVPGHAQPVLVRVTPDIRPDTHEAVSTGQRGSKFGLLLPQAAR